MVLSLKHLFFDTPSEIFTEETAPDWLTSVNTIPGFTMDHRWFWKKFVLTLPIGKSIETDFYKITRIG